MSLLRKFMGPSRQLGPEAPQPSNQDNALGLMHLRKLFAEFRHPTGASQRELEDRLYNMLPLFCKVFGTAPSSDMTEKFGDILQFCSHVSRLMVSEVRRRASNQSTEKASLEIVKFLEIDSTEEASNGWMLLSTINLLSTGAPSLIDCMTAASLPSTLVKCLYLFFDLPEVEDADVLEPGHEFTPRERRILLQKVFSQVLVRLCSHVSPAEELARKDDLILLFQAITSWCPMHNVPWRKSAAEVLMTLSRHGLTPNVVQYIHSKGCVSQCIENMHRMQELSPIELVEMFVTVFCFLKDSSDVSQMLMDDFRTCQGYVFLSEFLLKMERDESEEAIQALRNLVLLVGSLTTCGFIELKPGAASAGSLFQMPGFSIPQPAGKGVSVRNIQAFQVLQTVFLKSTSPHLCSTILDVISSIYHQDNANYFILEPQNTLSQFAERVPSKTAEIQSKYLELLEFVVFNLNYVPCKELISLSLLIKANHSINCSILCMKTLLRILQYHAIYKDVFREVGLLEVFVTCLHRYAALLKEPQEGQEPESLPETQAEMGRLTMDTISLLLSGNSSNAGVFRECGGARCAHNMVPFTVCRNQTLMMVQQLVLSNGGDDDMGTLLGFMHTAPVSALELKTHVLKALLHVLKESHRTRTVFRKVNGFLYVMSVLVSMEGCLADPPKAPWDKAEKSDIVTLLRTVFSTMTVAMRYEPANAKFFATDVRYASLTEAVRLLGCFSTDVDVQPAPRNLKPWEDNIFSDFFYTLKEDRWPNDLPRSMMYACMMLRFLYDTALDYFEKPIQNHMDPDITVLRHSSSNLETIQHDSCSTPVRPNVNNLSLTLNSTQQEAVIVHAGAVVSMLHLVPAIACEENTQLALDLQFFTCEVIKSLVRSERNQQVMCESGLPHELLTHCNITLADENHPLHPPIQYMFERLAAQALTPKDLRDFLRLGGPLCSSAEDAALPYLGTRGSPDGGVDKPANMERRTPNDIKKKLCTNGGAVPLTRVKCLVSMTTPRDVRLHGSTITPGFVEFDMSAEGFGCLYLPSIAPQGPPNPSVVGAGMIGGSDLAVVGGIGSGERLFPPPSGITFSSWFCIDKFSSGKGDAHPVRLLSLVRNIQGKEENLVCLSVYLTARDRALIVSTQETRMPSGNGYEPEHEPVLGDTTVRFWCPELTQEGQWRHLVLVFHRAGIMKNSSVSIYVDGQQVSTEKLHYISPNLGTGGTASASAATSVFSYIGTPPPLRRVSRLTWRQGPCHLIEDALPTASVQMIYNLGPNYVGNFQAPVVEKDLTGSLVPEDKVMFGVHAHAISLMTVAKIRKVFNKVDAKSIAKQLGMSAHENATPIRILHNSADCLSGPARSFGAIVMGYLGVRIFCPKPVSKMLMNVGGTSTLLGLIAMATDVEGLYAAVKALVCVVRSNRAAQREMDRTKGYQTLAVLFKKKRHLLNSHILHLTFSLVGTVDSGRETTIIPNRDAFEDLLCDLDVWHEAPADLQRSLYEHFFELLTESSEQKTNLQLMLDIGLVVRLLHVLKDPQLSKLTVHVVASVLTVLLSGANHHSSVLKFGQFLVSTLPSVSSSEKHLKLCDRPDGDGKASNSENSGLMSPVCIHNVQLRNICLDILMKLLTTQPLTNGVNSHVCEELQKTLGFDWLLLFMQGHLHPSTVVSAMRVLLLMLSSPGALQKFRDGTQGGGWLDETESVLQNRIGVLLGFNVGTGNSSKAQNRELNMEVCHMPGFISLQWLLPKHAEIPELYFLLMALLLGQQVKDLPSNIHFDLDSVWTFIYGVPASQPASLFNRHKTELCAEAATVILSMVRAVLNQSTDDVREGTWLQEYPVTLMQFLLFLYHNQADFLHMCLSADFLSALVATLFPYRITSESSSELNSPVEDFKPFPGSEGMVLVSTPDKATASSLTTHPARKFVMDFLRMIVVDSLSLPQSSKTAPVIDLLLDSSPEHASRRQRREFQTELLKLLMDHLLAADALLGEQAALPITPGGNYTHLANNIFYLAGRVVDKLWQGFYTGDPKEVFEFISKLISQAKRRASGMSLDGMYRCLNRTVLYQLSRPMYSVPHQMTVLDALHKLTSNRSLVFGPGNYDLDFIGCLCHCLLLLTDNPASLSDTPAVRTTVWHVDPEDSEEEQAAALAAGSSAGKEGFRLISNAAKRVWEELYVCKKPAIEEACKVPLTFTDPATSPKITTPDLHTVRNLIQEPASRAWVTYFENEQKCNYSQAQLQSQLQSRLQRVGHGVLRLASRKSKRDQPVKPSPASVQDYSSWTLTHVSIVRDLVEIQHQQFKQSQHHMEKFLLEEWSVTETELMRERGLWGPPTGSELDKWSLDHTEGPSRMRKKMIRNDLFYIHYPYRPDLENDKPQKYKVAISFDSRKYFERYRAHSLVGEETLPHSQSQSSDLGKDEVDSEPQTPENLLEMPTNIPSLLPRIKRETSSNQVAGMENDDDTDYDPGATDASGTTEGASEGEPNQVQSGDYQSVIRLLEEGEQISHMFRCARVQGLDNAEGLLLFGKYHFYVVDGFTLLKTKDISDIESLSPEHHEPIIPKSCVGSNRPPKRMCGKFCYEDIKEVHKRRYLLQPTALEVFSADGRTLLLVFPRKIRNKVYTRFITVATALADTAQESVSGQRQNAKVEAGTGLISSLMGEKSVTQRWERGEISNFEYLMCLNTLAGRSYNDLMQYPVFPWILADYESEELDLSDEKTFRDLSKPMGAQTPDRLKQFKKRYSDWEDPQGETPPYHYGTHYSSAMIVASYLVRMEPFTQHFLRLQGGHFDLADRMFHSVGDGWMSASKHNMADVKELIPEFFYLPEFLLNSNHFDLGTKQSGVSLHDVVLPVWAKGDPREFIRVHREALECDYVSAHLNEWIDLIFGYKQQGPLAVDAVNVFHHLFYEGNVDINSIDDPLKKNAIVGFINNFGQIPSQLFKKPHPQKKLSLRNLDPMPMGSLVNGTNDKVFFHHVDNLKPSMQPIKELKHPVGQIVHSDKAILAVPQNQVLVPPQYNKYLAWGFPDLTLKMGNYDSDKASCVFENLDNGEILCASCPSAKLVITAGTSTVVNVWEVSKKKDRKALTLKKPLYGHTEPVTCLASSITYNIIVSGSRDRTCIVWDLGMLCFLRQLQGHAAPVAAVAINDLTGDIATCAGTYLHLWSINGDEVASINTATGRNQQILCVAMSQMMEWDPQNVILTGNNDGVVRMWSVEFVEVPDETQTKQEKNKPGETAKVEQRPQTLSEPHNIPNIHRLCSLEDSISETTADTVQDYRDNDMLGVQVEAELGSSVESGGTLTEAMKGSEKSNQGVVEGDLISFDSPVQEHPPQRQISNLSSVSGSDFTEEGPPAVTYRQPERTEPDGAALSVGRDQSSQGPVSQREQGSPTSDFETFSDKEVKAAMKSVEDVLQIRKGQKNKLRPGFKWQRQLVFRSKLTMHTAFERRDNNAPAPVTSLAISKDHKTVYVGDGKCRVFSWSVTDQPGRVIADHWVKDEGGDSCNNCNVKFTFSERRHHCRNCGQLYCSKCSRFETEIHRLRIMKPVRVCQTCFSKLKVEQANAEKSNRSSVKV